MMMRLLLMLVLAVTPMTGSVTSRQMLGNSSVWRFPCAGDLRGQAAVRFASPPQAGTTLTLTTALDDNVPDLVGVFSVEVSKPVHLRSSPAWVVRLPRGGGESDRYEIDVYDRYLGAQRAYVSYAARRRGNELSFSWFGPRLDLEPGHRYLFELIENGTLNRLPH